MRSVSASGSRHVSAVVRAAPARRARPATRLAGPQGGGLPTDAFAG